MFDNKTLSSILFNFIISLVLITDYYILYPVLFLILFILSLIEWFRISKNNHALLSFLTFYIMPQLFLWCIIFPPYGSSVTIWYFSIIWSYRVLSYLGDKLIGGPKFFQSIINNKTLSGLVLGTVGSFITSCVSFKYLIYYKEQEHRIEAVIAVIILILHDLIYAKIKQVLEVKDYKKTIVLDNFGYFISIMYAGIVQLFVAEFPYLWRYLCKMFN